MNADNSNTDHLQHVEEEIETIDAEELEENLSMFDDWAERYQYIIDLGKQLEPLPAAAKNDANKVRGCMSQVWLDHEIRTTDDEQHLHFFGDSDSVIVRGLIAVLFSLYSDQTPATILAADLESFFKRIGLEQHLSPNRRNGFFSMVERIRQTAQAAIAQP